MGRGGVLWYLGLGRSHRHPGTGRTPGIGRHHTRVGGRGSATGGGRGATARGIGAGGVVGRPSRTYTVGTAPATTTALLGAQKEKEKNKRKRSSNHVRGGKRIINDTFFINNVLDNVARPSRVFIFCL